MNSNRVLDAKGIPLRQHRADGSHRRAECKPNRKSAKRLALRQAGAVAKNGNHVHHKPGSNKK